MSMLFSCPYVINQQCDTAVEYHLSMSREEHYNTYCARCIEHTLEPVKDMVFIPMFGFENPPL